MQDIPYLKSMPGCWRHFGFRLVVSVPPLINLHLNLSISSRPTGEGRGWSSFRKIGTGPGSDDVLIYLSPHNKIPFSIFGEFSQLLGHVSNLTGQQIDFLFTKFGVGQNMIQRSQDSNSVNVT